VKKVVSKLLQLGLVIAGALVTALSLPEGWKVWGSVVSATAGVIAFMLVPICVNAQKPILASSILASSVLVGLIFGLVCFGFESKTVLIVNDQPYIKGDLLPKADTYIKQHNVSEAFYLEGSAYKPEDVWSADSVARNSWILLSLFSGVTFFLAFGMLGALELIPELEPKKENLFWKILPWGLFVGTLLLFIGFVWFSLHYVITKIF
jgi:hypothetical protein